MYTDQIGNFNIRSIRGHNYVVATYCCDANAILDRPLRSRKGFELLETIKETHQHLELLGYKPNHKTLENEISTTLRDHLKKMA